MTLLPTESLDSRNEFSRATSSLGSSALFISSTSLSALVAIKSKICYKDSFLRVHREISRWMWLFVCIIRGLGCILEDCVRISKVYVP